MFVTKIFHFRRFAIIFLIIFWSHSLLQGSQMNDIGPVISFSAENQSVGTILNRLVLELGMNLTFTSSDPDFGRTITYSAVDKPASQILSEILALIGYEYSRVGNQMVVHRSAIYIGSGAQGTSDHTNPPDTIIKIVEVPVIVTDTIVIRDTIVQVRYLQSLSTGVRPLIASRSVLSRRQIREENWTFSISYGQMVAGFRNINVPETNPDLDDVRRAESSSVSNMALTAAINYKTGALRMGAGLSLNSHANPFNYAELYTTGGFFRVDTLDAFFTIINGEQIWTYVTDSVYIPLESQEVFIERTNRLGILELQLGFSYDVYVIEDITFFFNGGINMGTPIWLNGLSVIDQEGYPSGSLSRSDLNPWILGYQFGFGVKTRLNNQADLVLGSLYKRYVNELYPDHPIDRRLHGVAIQLGLIYYL
ncbi:MAG: hypothetical protein EA394_07810 [Bacteroidia bacterium]|nr:MAG: hypothetical protein EA394_07810 [Bacteroidia bacterium]